MIGCVTRLVTTPCAKLPFPSSGLNLVTLTVVKSGVYLRKKAVWTDETDTFFATARDQLSEVYLQKSCLCCPWNAPKGAIQGEADREKGYIKKIVVSEKVKNAAKPGDGPGRYWIGLDLGDEASRFCILKPRRLRSGLPPRAAKPARHPLPDESLDPEELLLSSFLPYPKDAPAWPQSLFG